MARIIYRAEKPDSVTLALAAVALAGMLLILFAALADSGPGGLIVFFIFLIFMAILGIIICARHPYCSACDTNLNEFYAVPGSRSFSHCPSCGARFGVEASISQLDDDRKQHWPRLFEKPISEEQPEELSARNTGHFSFHKPKPESSWNRRQRAVMGTACLISAVMFCFPPMVRGGSLRRAWGGPEYHFIGTAPPGVMVDVGTLLLQFLVLALVTAGLVFLLQDD